MTIREAVLQHLQALPESAQAEVLDFVEFLEMKVGIGGNGCEQADWSGLSLSQAMRGMENEPSLYTISDLKEIF